MSALADELLAALNSPRGREILGEALRPVVREELLALQSAGDPNELLDAEAAYPLLGYPTASALRRAAERGTAPVEPIRQGRRLRWRRGALLAVGARK
jgi:hypothetical protein